MKKILGSLFIHISILFSKIHIIILRLFAKIYAQNYSGETWILLERGIDAQDNAWHLFKYLRKCHPEIDVKYAIRLKSPDFKKNLNGYHADVIEYGSLRYFLELYNAKYVISTHIQSYAYYHSIFSWLQESRYDISAKKIFLQHGCLHNFIPSFEYPKLKVSLFIAGALNEYKLLRSVYKYPETVLKYTGLARFDNLHDFTPEKIILIMPTWRAKYASLSGSNIKQTDFYVSYRRVLTDSKLIDKLKHTGYKILFYNHMEFQKFNFCFEDLTNDYIKLVRFGETSVQQLLKRASILITDYSSVYYDFFYMKKPILFYRFNEEEFQSYQYGRDYDNPSNFGFVTDSNEELVNTLISTIDGNCKIGTKYLEFHNSIYPLCDRWNCERIYESISML